MAPLTIGSLCAGIGGIELGLEMTGGFRTAWQAEIDPFARRVLAKHWPDALRLEDVRDVCRDTVPRVDLITAGLPCQPHSLAGKRQSSNDKRDLWAEFARIVGDFEPRWLMVENVPGILSSHDPAYGNDYPGAYFGRILSDLAALGYDAEWQCIRAADVGAPHIRNRMFLLAYPHIRQSGQRCEPHEKRGRAEEAQQIRVGGSSRDVPDADRQRCREQHTAALSERAAVLSGRIDEAGRAWAPESGMGGTLNGFSTWLDRFSGLSESHKLLWAYANATQRRPQEVLQALRYGVQPQDDRGAIRRPLSIPSSEILLTYLCKLQDGGSGNRHVFQESAEVSRERMRSLWTHYESSSTSPRSRQDKQRGRKYSNALHALSHVLAHDAEEAWQTYRRENAESVLNPWGAGWEIGTPRISNGVPNRIHRLRTLGNAVVPQVARWIGERILAAERAA